MKPMTTYPRQRLAILALTLLLATATAQSQVDTFTGRPRVVVLSDIGNEPDDQMSLVRFLLYSNQFDVEAHLCVMTISRPMEKTFCVSLLSRVITH